jgi:hypothetical protein
VPSEIHELRPPRGFLKAWGTWRIGGNARDAGMFKETGGRHCHPASMPGLARDRSVIKGANQVEESGDPACVEFKRRRKLEQ